MRVEILVALIAGVASVGAAYITATKAAATTARDAARTEARDTVSETTGRIVERIEQPSVVTAGAVDKNGNADKSATGVYLIRTENPEVSRHVGQEVELSGRIVPAGTTAGANGAASSSAGTASTVGSTGAGTSTTAPQTLEVRTVRMIASVCAAR